MGKSALGLQMALNAARSGTQVLLLSLEMQSTELGRRLLSVSTGIPVAALKGGRLSVDDAERVVVASRELSALPLDIIDTGGLSAAHIAVRVRAFRRKQVGLVVVDHLHIVRPDETDARSGATWAVGRISGAMKRIAKDNGVPVLLLAQLNRGVEGRDDKRPMLSDLRQAGDIEQDADAVGFVYRPEYYMGSEPERGPSQTEAKYVEALADFRTRKIQAHGKAEVIWAKVRDGEPGTDHLRFDGRTTSFREPE